MREDELLTTWWALVTELHCVSLTCSCRACDVCWI